MWFCKLRTWCDELFFNVLLSIFGDGFVAKKIFRARSETTEKQDMFQAYNDNSFDIKKIHIVLTLFVSLDMLHE